MNRTEYKFELLINERKIEKVIIDQHYKEKHGEHISEELILEVLKELDGEIFNPIMENDLYQYFKVEPVVHDDAPYRLIFLLYVNEDTLGVVNCFRVQRRIYGK